MFQGKLQNCKVTYKCNISRMKRLYGPPVTMIINMYLSSKMGFWVVSSAPLLLLHSFLICMLCYWSRPKVLYCHNFNCISLPSLPSSLFRRKEETGWWVNCSIFVVWILAFSFCTTTISPLHDFSCQRWKGPWFFLRVCTYLIHRQNGNPASLCS